MKKDNRVCICCGTSYRYCSGCAEYAHLPQWKNIYDKIECKVIFDVATDYNAKLITKEEAKTILSKYDVKNINMKESLNKVINEILGDNTIKTNAEKPVEKNTEKVKETVEKKYEAKTVMTESVDKNAKKK